jgi:hypothetical protein
LRLDVNRPAAVFGPVLFLAFRRLAAICFSLAKALVSVLVHLIGPVAARFGAPGHVLLQEANSR